ncbi:ABC transporter-related protein [Sulfurimonas denitrificans DSM 1251]|uniref:ABC transporter-related protein n=1 Tax=Sulfurimonas denitrificans (strain ATCC 33889 / DSM 1251) TaxID=326298 RepID=Q30UI6_SULDN|nr:ABC transporter ATP-binding protein [Sulfurimonas denitrificans]ABB43345.1 ABC transporter-related protein [Sulfurimonas denitrificans DSM 1251]MDD3442303.1 ABC transporter ATP-binding protein [Sulfurimonas denitrificans]
MIECKNLSYNYQDFQLNTIEVLKDISFKIDKGEKVLLLGINGSGKSTLLKLLNGLLYAKSGEYYFKNELVNKKYLKANSKDFRKSVSLQMQDPSSMLFNPTVYDEIAFGLKHFGFESVDERVYHYAKVFEIENILKSSPLSLSGGQKQKVLLASLLCVEPEVLLLDEPTAHLDPPTTGWLVEFLDSLDVTALISTHNISLGKELAGRAIVIGINHEIVYDGEVQALLEDMPTLIKAQLVHKHKHAHEGVEHKHYHLHSWT